MVQHKQHRRALEAPLPRRVPRPPAPCRNAVALDLEPGSLVTLLRLDFFRMSTAVKQAFDQGVVVSSEV